MYYVGLGRSHVHVPKEVRYSEKVRYSEFHGRTKYTISAGIPHISAMEKFYLHED